jgi:branched-chain amino acid transport system ATP-binding protein
MMARHIAIAVLKTEHRALHEVLRLLEALLEEFGAGTLLPDRELLASILYYVDEFSERLHHPKEEQFLFSAIVSRAGTRPPLLEVLALEHRESAGITGELRRLLAQIEAQQPNALAQFGAAAGIFVNAQRAHMQREETELLPLAELVLEDDDWVRLATAFTANDDPLFGQFPRAEFARLRSRLTALAPPGLLSERSRPWSPYEPLW